jgi:hypothetical protein
LNQFANGFKMSRRGNPENLRLKESFTCCEAPDEDSPIMKAITDILNSSQVENWAKDYDGQLETLVNETKVHSARFEEQITSSPSGLDIEVFKIKILKTVCNLNLLSNIDYIHGFQIRTSQK